MEALLGWDRSLLKLINNEWSNPFFDVVLPYLRIAQCWVPLYLFLVLFATINFRASGWRWVLFFIVTVVITNFISSDLIKGNIKRIRPCDDPALADWLRVLVKYKPHNSSFTSSHAANHFGLAMFSYITFKEHFRFWPGLFFIWAASICYAQMYVGVHYPLDILAGTIVGLVIGYATATLFNNKFGLRQA